MVAWRGGRGVPERQLPARLEIRARPASESLVAVPELAAPESALDPGPAGLCADGTGPRVGAPVEACPNEPCEREMSESGMRRRTASAGHSPVARGGRTHGG